MTLAERVKKRRRQLGLAQVKAADLAGIHQQSWAVLRRAKPASRATSSASPVLCSAAPIG